jgi:replicative DNA helicase
VTAPVDDQPELPNDLDSEKALLGAILVDPSRYEVLGDRVTAGHFYRRAHQQIFGAISRILDAPHGALDLVTLRTELKRTSELKDVGGPAYLASLMDGMPLGSNVKQYARIVREKAMLRQCIATGKALTARAYAAQDPVQAIVRQTDLDLQDILAGSDRRGFTGPKAAFGELLEGLDFNLAHRGQLTGLSTGFSTIDAMTWGWQPSDMIVVGARPSIGKTAFVGNTAVAAASQGAVTAVYSLEMRRQQLAYRAVSAMSGVPATAIQRGYLTPEMQLSVSEAATRYAELPIYVNDRASQTVGEIRAGAKRIKAEHGLGLLIIDYIQLMPGSLKRRDPSRNEELTDISRKLKVLAGELNCPVIVVSQLKRLSGARPTIEDLRECGSLEQDADIVALLHRKQHSEGGLTNFLLAKQRNGPTGTVNLSLDRDIQLFTDAGAATPEQTQAEEGEDAQHRKTRAIIRARAHAK